MHVVPCTKSCTDYFATFAAKCVQRGVYLHDCTPVHYHIDLYVWLKKRALYMLVLVGCWPVNSVNA